MALVHQKTFARAAGIVGGTCQLASRQHVQPAEVEAWLRGEEPPLAAFLAAADMVCDSAIEMLAQLHGADANTREATPEGQAQEPDKDRAALQRH